MSSPQSIAIRIRHGIWLRSLGRPPAWIVLLAAVPLLVALYVLLPTDGIARTLAYPAFGLIGTIAILIGIHHRPPAQPRSWKMIALALALLSLGDVTYSILHSGGEVPYPSLADIGYLFGYVCLIAGFGGLVRGRMAGGDRTSVIDAAILSAGAGSLFWITIIQPSVQGSVDPLAGTISMAYPAMDLILLALGLRVLLRPGSRPRYLQFLVAGVFLYFVADVIYAKLVIDGTYGLGHPVDVGWIIGILLFGVAALHPSITDPVQTVESAGVGISRPRLALLAGAALLAPAILLSREVQPGDEVVPGLVAGCIVLFTLVLVRLSTTVDQLALSLRERRRLQNDLAHQATHDPLTQLANGLLFEQRLAAALATAPEKTALIFLDLDDFKAINDTLGHPTGDELLRIVGARLKNGLRETDVAARLGGDEFAILVEGCDNAASARGVAERALTGLRSPLTVAGGRVFVHASAGVAMGGPRSTALALMRDADIAMYRAKSRGKDRVVSYEAGMQSQITRTYELRTALAEAIDNERFVLHYQPIVDLGTGNVVGAEALVRWNHPSRGLLSPVEFIGEAESSGLILELGRWILREACTTAAAWPDRSDGGRVAIGVNLAASQLLDPRLVEDVAQILAETGIPANRLVLEVTESALVDLDVARVALMRLRGLGVRLALDDFGTGYSALSYLAELPFDLVKIDRSFISGIGGGARSDALLEGILGLCDALKLQTVAEGIEQVQQLDRLRALPCSLGQGYLFARPVEAAAFPALMAAPMAQIAPMAPMAPIAPIAPIAPPIPAAWVRRPSRATAVRAAQRARPSAPTAHTPTVFQPPVATIELSASMVGRAYRDNADVDGRRPTSQRVAWGTGVALLAFVLLTIAGV